MAVHESRVLRPKNPSIQDENAWEEFPLVNVEVKDLEGRPASLLAADERSPLTITGRLDRLPHDQQQFLINRDSLPATLEIVNVVRFAYGQYDDQEIAIWAAGESGWFKIRPSRTYKAIYKNMVEAIATLYFLADLYREWKQQRKKPPPVSVVLDQYAEQPQFKCSDPESAAYAIRKHKDFLLDSMAKGKEGINWKQAELFNYLQQQPSISDVIEEATASPEISRITMEEDRPARPVGRGKGLSAVRAKGTKHSSKGALRLPSSILDQDEDMADVSLPESPRNQTSTQLRNGRPRKRARTLESQAEDTTMTDANNSVVTSADIPLPIRSGSTRLNRSRQKGKPLIVKIIECPLPSYEAQGPGDTWMCKFDGCSHRIYGASTPKSRALIKEHYRSHAIKSQAKIDLVYQEERPYLPVSHLVQKIREHAAQNKDVPSLMGTKPISGPQFAMKGPKEMLDFPKPIERKFGVA